MAQDKLEMRMIDETIKSTEDVTMDELISRVLADKLNKTILEVEEDLELTKKRILARLKEVTLDKSVLVYKIVEEEIEMTKKRISASSKFASLPRRLGNHSSAGRTMKLQFRNKISQNIIATEEIKGENKNSIEVVLVDDSTGNTVEDGPEASATVQILVLKGDDWRVEGFDEHIVPEMEGKKLPLLEGNVLLKLERGVAVLNNIKFRNHASKKPSLFRLGARIVEMFDGCYIKEAKTESFTVKDYRNKYFNKPETPSLHDEVSKLINIRRRGAIDKRLQNNKICTVEDFLIRLLRDPQGLKNIVNLGARKWEVIVNNARTCPSGTKMYCYINSEQKMGIVFNVLGQVLGLYLKSQNTPTSILVENHKADIALLLASSYENWEDVKSFDDMNSLEQHLSVLSTRMDPTNPDYPGHGRENTETCEMIGESSSRHSNYSHLRVSSTMNSTGVEDFYPFCIDDVEIDYNAPFPHSPCSPFNPGTPFLQDFDGSGITFVESQVIQISTQLKRWKKLLCIMKLLFANRKKGNQHRKKQRVL